VKLGADLGRVQAMAEAGLTPPVLAAGELEDGTPLLVQPLIEGWTPRAPEFNDHLEQVAGMVRTMHHDEGVKGALVPPASQSYREAGRAALADLRRRWEQIKPQVPGVAEFVDAGLARIGEEIERFEGEGPAASHNDICNDNWLLCPDGRLYIVDLDLMSMEDPACDVGALLWWYYPPEARRRFLEVAGYPNDESFQARMQTRMAMHCLRITLPRAGSFDCFDPASYPERLNDFRAALNGDENPQGYWRTL
jgi:hypothetical protein